MYLRKNNTATLVFTTLVAVGLFLVGYTRVDAATLQITSNSTTLSPGEIMTLSVVVDSGGVAINNAEAKIVFPKDLLEVVSVSKGGSVFSLWVEEPAYSNVTGVITFNGGIPTPGFKGSNGTALSFVVKAKTTGQADILFSDAAVRANDGLGTNVLSSKKGKTITITKKEEPTIEDTPTAAPSIAALHITSPTHPSQEAWYAEDNPLFRWKIPTGVDAVQTAIDTTTSGVPRVTYSPAINEKSVKDLDDGIWYFKVRARSNGEWGPTSTYIARIDSTIPKKNGVIFSYDDAKKVLNIESDIVDETSGLDYYEVYVNNLLIKKVPSAEFVEGTYYLPFDTPGDATVRLLAVDRAGNSVESLGSFSVTVVAEQPVVPDKKQLLITMGSLSIPAWYLLVLILLIGIVLLFIAFTLGRHYGKFRNKFKTHALMGKEDNLKVLLVLKRRLEKHLGILQRIRHNRILTKEEKEIKEAIEGDLDEVDKVIERSRVDADSE